MLLARKEHIIEYKDMISTFYGLVSQNTTGDIYCQLNAATKEGEEILRQMAASTYSRLLAEINQLYFKNKQADFRIVGNKIIVEERQP